MLKAVLDLRLLRHVNTRIVKHNIEAFQSSLRDRLRDKNYYYILIRRRYALEDLAEQVKTLITSEDVER